MRLRSVHFHRHAPAGDSVILAYLRETINPKLDKIMSALDDLDTEVSTLQDSVTAAVTDIATLTQELTDANNNGDQTRITAVIAKLTAMQTALSSAVVKPDPTPATDPVAGPEGQPA